jgi:hypothetical protein
MMWKPSALTLSTNNKDKKKIQLRFIIIRDFKGSKNIRDLKDIKKEN